MKVGKGLAALVTGGAQGLGAATARRLHAQGAAVTLVDTNEKHLEAMARELGDRVLPIKADVTQED